MPKRYTDEEILDALRENPDLSLKDWIEKKIRPSQMTILHRFGSWNEAREAAGLETRPKGSHREGPTNKERMLNLLEEKRVVSSRELAKKGIPAHLTSFRKLVQEGVEVYRVDLRMGKARGGAKYKKSKLLKPDTPDVIYSINPRHLSDYLRNIFRFELTRDLDQTKRTVLTHYLKGRVPEEVMRELRSLYKEGEK